MEKWGADRYGQPCRECAFDWSLTPEEAVEYVKTVPDRFDSLLITATGNERHPELAWSVGEYVCHVGDNLRIWAERLAGTDAQQVVPDYDPDLIAKARHYSQIPLPGALWSLRWATREWVESLQGALASRVVLRHQTRDVQRAEDIARNNAHDAHHHLYDVDRILRS